MATMTKREMMNAIATVETITDEMREYAVAELAKMDEANRKRKGYVSPKQKAEKEAKVKGYTEMAATIYETLEAATTRMTSSELATALGVSATSINYVLKNYMDDYAGITVADVKRKGKPKTKGYAVGEVADEE